MSGWLWASLACNLLLAIAWFLTLGWGESYRTANKKLQQRVRSLEEPDPLCGCGHHISFHDEKGCHYTVVYTRPAKFGVVSLFSDCPCVKYVGPEPLPKVISLESIQQKKEEEPDD